MQIDIRVRHNRASDEVSSVGSRYWKMPSDVHLGVAGEFCRDACDFLQRSHVTMDSLGAARSQRVKSFADLRLAYECALKSVIAIFDTEHSTRYELLEALRRFGHRIGELEEAGRRRVCTDLGLAEQQFGTQLDALPADLRYAAELHDLRAFGQELYYQTIGLDPWLAQLSAYIGEIVDAMQLILGQHTRIVHVSEIATDPHRLKGAKVGRLRRLAQYWKTGRRRNASGPE